jgi:hypothetical protein
LKISLRLLLSAGVLALLGHACSGPTPADRSPRSLSENQDRFVRVEAHSEDRRPEGVARFSHPVRLSPAEWARILSSVRIQSRKDSFIFTPAKEPPTEAFAPEEIAYLSRTLSETFAKTAPEQQVVFGLSRVLPSGVNEVTTGGLFVVGSRLHLILANYRHSVTKAGVREQLWNEPLRTVSAPFYDVVRDDYHTVMEKGVLSGLRNAGSEIAIEYQALLKAPAGVAAPAVTPTPQAVAPPPGAAAEKPSLVPESSRIPPATAEEHLRTLKRLRELDLITEEEYRQKKKEILDRF